MENAGYRFTVEYLPQPDPAPERRVDLPNEFDPRKLAKRAIPVFVFLVVIGLVLWLAPGLGEVRDKLAGAQPGWLALGVAFEFLSGVSYVLMFRPIFCRHMPWRTSWEISWSELAMGSLVPASGAGGLALGAWILHEGGMDSDRIARRSVAFFLVKSSVNFVAVAVLGIALWLGLFGPDLSPWLTIVPAVLSIAVIAAIIVIGRLPEGDAAPDDAPRLKRWWATARRSLVGGTTEAVAVVRSGDPLVIAGSIGYWAWDNAVLWATFHAFGANVPLTVILMGYLIGQLGGLLPIPGGIGGIDGGLLGTLVVFGAPAAATAAAVFAYRLILFWLPLLVGAVAFASLRRGLNKPHRPDLCAVPSATG